MKTPVGILLIAVAFSLAVFTGCSSDSASPVASAPQDDAPDFVKLPQRVDKSLSKVVTATQFLTAAEGGTIRLVSNYKAAPDSHQVNIEVTLEVKPGDLPYDASLTISLDDVVFMTNVDLTFGPHGIVFNHPVKLSANASGLDGDIRVRHLKLYYIDNNAWVPMPGSSGQIDDGELEAKGKLPHFSQYAFGRVDD